MSDLNHAQRTIFFAYNSAALDKTAISALDDKVRLLKKYPRVRIAIAGNCDSRGTEAYNMALGDKRAAAARDYLVAHGIDAGRIDVSSNGSSQPSRQERHRGGVGEEPERSVQRDHPEVVIRRPR